MAPEKEEEAAKERESVPGVEGLGVPVDDAVFDDVAVSV